MLNDFIFQYFAIELERYCKKRIGALSLFNGIELYD